MAANEEGAAVDSNDTLVDTESDLGRRIRASLVFLCKNSTNLPEVLVQLYSHSLLCQREAQVIEKQLSDFDSFYKLFTFVIPRLRHGENSLHFLDALQKSGNEHILEKLKSAVVTTDFALSPLGMASPRVGFNVREPVASFVGRENFLRDLHQQILQRELPSASVTTTSTIVSRISVVTGLGGIGKTETIRKYIHTYGRFYHHVVWIDAEEQNTAKNQFRRLALELQLPSKDIDDKAKDFEVTLKDIYDRLCTKHTLLVLDNAEALHDSDPQRPGVARFLPKSLPHTHIKPVILITSRHQDWPDLQLTPLPLLTPQESSVFLLRQLNLKESDANRKDCTILSESFGGLPLALHAAVAVIRQQSKWNKLMGKDVYTIQHLLSDYNKGKREVLKKRPPCSPDTQPLMFLWKVSLDKIRQQPHGHLATQILNVMAHLSPTNIPKDLLFFIFNSEDIDTAVDAVALLVDYSFVHDFRTHFSIHRMLQDVTLAHLKTAAEQNLNKGESLLASSPLMLTVTALMKYWPKAPKSSKAYDAVHDNLVHVTMSHVLPKAQKPSKTDLHFIEFVMTAIIDTRWEEAEKCCRVLIAYFTSKAIPSNSASPCMSSNFLKNQQLRRKLAGILREMGRYKEAENICQELLSSFNSLEDQEDVMSEILDTKHRLAMILYSQGEHEEAIKLFYRIIDLRSKLHGPNHKFTLSTKNNLALTLKNSGRLSEAKTLYVEVLEVRIKELGQLNLSTLTAKHNMAMILVDEGHYDDALEMLREVEEVKEKKLGPLHADTLKSKECMAHVLEKQNKHEDALRIYADVISKYEKTSAASHPDCLNAKHSMAVILGEQGRLDEAKEMLCHVLDMQERLLGPSHVSILITKHNVTWVLEKQGKLTQALKLYEEVLELKTKQLGTVHPSTLQTNYNIGWLHLKMGNFEKAESIAKEVLAARQATLPTDHPSIKDTEKLYKEARLRNYPCNNQK